MSTELRNYVLSHNQQNVLSSMEKALDTHGMAGQDGWYGVSDALQEQVTVEQLYFLLQMP